MRKICIEVEHEIGDIVYINTDKDQDKYLVMGYGVRDNYILYELYSHGYGDYTAFPHEISRDKDVDFL